MPRLRRNLNRYFIFSFGWNSEFDLREPVDPDNPLLGIDNCTLTNHRGGDTINSYSDSPEAMMKAAQEFFEGDRPRYWINPEIERTTRIE